MIASFRNRGTEDILRGIDSQVARSTCAPAAWPAARRKLALLDSAHSLNQLKTPYGNRLELLKRDRAGQFAIRINDKYRICFWWTDMGAENVEITDYH